MTNDNDAANAAMRVPRRDHDGPKDPLAWAVIFEALPHGYWQLRIGSKEGPMVTHDYGPKKLRELATAITTVITAACTATTEARIADLERLLREKTIAAKAAIEDCEAAVEREAAAEEFGRRDTYASMLDDLSRHLGAVIKAPADVLTVVDAARQAGWEECAEAVIDLLLHPPGFVGEGSGLWTAIREQVVPALRRGAHLERLPATAPEGLPDPVPMVLHCPECRMRHVDAGEFATKSHHTHACQGCGFTWRPAVVATVGVQFLPGFRDEPPGPHPPGDPGGSSPLSRPSDDAQP